MKIYKNIDSYPYLSVIVMFASLGSIVSGLIAQLIILWIFKDGDFAQIGYQPLIYVGLISFIPALLTGAIIACTKLRQADDHRMLLTFSVGFLISALYIAAIILYLGLSFTIEEVGLLFITMLIFGLFGAVNAAITSFFALPIACTTHFDKFSQKPEDSYLGLRQIE